MLLSKFDFDFPVDLIADKPLEKRDTSRMLVFDGTNAQDKKFTDILGFLKKGDVLVLNNSKVIPARVSGTCNEAKASITLIKKLESHDQIWKVLAKPAKKLTPRSRFIISDDFHAEILSKDISGEITLKFNLNGKKFFDALHNYGSMPLPPYIEKKRKAEEVDKKTYQTVYANEQKEGSVAAPTAGLHFTDEVLQKIKEKGVEIAYVTLHVGAGTFFPVRVENISEHKMHTEYFELPDETAEKINKAKEQGGRVIAVGTTSLRVLESASVKNEKISAKTGETDIFISPGYEFKLVDILLTNFHLPKSTLFILVSAFMGVEKMQKLYKHAIENKYRFFSYGDCSLLIRDKIVP